MSNEDIPLYPYPDGWYVIEAGDRLQKEQVIQKTWMGQEIVAWRDEAGSVCVAGAFCPHLGAHLGPDSGGLVRRECLVCPFHGFEFDVSGQCVTTPLAPPPRLARLKSYPVQEVNGFVFAYWGHQGQAPMWHISDVSDGNWTGRVASCRSLKSHPQATTENSVDFGHLLHVHGYKELEQTAPTTIDGPLLTASYSFWRHMLTPGLSKIGFGVEIKISVWGLGVSLVEVFSPSTELRVLQWVMARPVDGEYIDLWLAVDPKGPVKLGRIGQLPSWISNGVVPKLLLHELELEVMKDADIWKHQRYVHRPMLSKGDRDVNRFRGY